MRNKIFNIMPYILGGLILILVGVIVVSELKKDSKEILSEVSKNMEDESKKDVSAGTKADDKKEPQVEKEITPEPTLEPTKAPTPTPTPEPTPEPTATPTPKPTEAPITDLTMGLSFEPKSDFVDTKSGINLRLGATTKTSVVAFLEEGMRLERTGYNDSWTRVIYDGQECYLATYLVIRAVPTYDTVVPEEEWDDDDEEEDAVPAGEKNDDKSAEDENFDDDNEEESEDDDEDENWDDEWDDEDDNWDEEDVYPGDDDEDDEDDEWDEDWENYEDEDMSLLGYWFGTGKTIVCIDPGHQKKADSTKEPIGPGATETKAKVSSGTAGDYTGYEEYKLNLDVSLKLKDELVKRGYKVVLTRTSHDVTLSNKERAEIANDSGALAFVRIHANSVSDHSVSGIETMCMNANSPYNADLYEQSYELSQRILNNMILQTGAKIRPVVLTNEMSGINWSDVPVTIVEMGFMSNEKEDKLLITDEYQNKIVKGIADGIDEYFEEF